jgi:hypothetical protein
MRDPVQPEETALRRAVQSGDFAGAERAAGLYVAALEAALPRMPRDLAASRLGEACQRIEWARRCLCVARVGLSEERSGVQHLAAFQRMAEPDRLHTWKIDG